MKDVDPPHCLAGWYGTRTCFAVYFMLLLLFCQNVSSCHWFSVEMVCFLCLCNGKDLEYSVLFVGSCLWVALLLCFLEGARLVLEKFKVSDLSRWLCLLGVRRQPERAFWGGEASGLLTMSQWHGVFLLTFLVLALDGC